MADIGHVQHALRGVVLTGWSGEFDGGGVHAGKCSQVAQQSRQTIIICKLYNLAPQ
jgi:hypothetical protein